MSKRKASKSVLTIHKAVNTLFADKDCDQDEVENDLDDFCGQLDEENEKNSDQTEQLTLEDEIIENIDDGEEQPLKLPQ